MDWQPFLGSALVAGIVAGFVSWRNSERSIQMQNITGERAKWRDKVRTIAADLRQAVTAKDTSKIKGLRLELSLNLNPLDEEDKKILAAIVQMESPDSADEKLQELYGRLALLLKHDWDRAKREAKPWKFLPRVRRHHYHQKAAN